MATDMGAPHSVLDTWEFCDSQASTSVILPDGCQDLIFCVDEHRAATHFVSPLANSAYSVPSSAGTTFLGFRFQPGAQINAVRLLAAVAAEKSLDQGKILGAIDSCVRVNAAIREALLALAESPRVLLAARGCGVSERSFERLLVKATNRPPNYWRCLARVRRAGAALAKATSLADIAAMHGYADQAHLQRDVKRWFGATPAQIRRSPALLRSLNASGYS